MDRAALAKRNAQLAALQHRRTGREYLRRVLLRFVAMVPALPARRPDRDTILLVRPDHLGDVLLSMPAIQALKRACPAARLVALVGPWSAEAIAAYPEIDLVLTLPFPGFARNPEGKREFWPSMTWRWARQIRQLRASTAIILRPDHWWGGLLVRLAGIPRRIGCNQWDLRPFLTERVNCTERHAALQCAQLVERLTGPLSRVDLRLRFPVDEVDRQYIRDRLDVQLVTDGSSAHEARSGRLVVIHPGAGSAIKFWPVENWAFVADRLAERLDAQVVFTGSDREHPQIWKIMDAMRHQAISLAGETNLGQLAALFERAAVVLGPDTGPLHLAVASGAPTVHLFGPADPVEFGPFGDPHRQVVLASGIGCRPCRILDWSGDDPANHPCVREIDVAQVAETALQIAQHR